MFFFHLVLSLKSLRIKYVIKHMSILDFSEIGCFSNPNLIWNSISFGILEKIFKYYISASKNRRMRIYIKIPQEFRSEKQPPVPIGHSEDNYYG